MVWFNALGALLIILGVLHMARRVIFRGKASDPHSSPSGGPTLEPKQSGIPAFGLATNWPGLVLIALGVITMLFGRQFWPS